MNIIQHGKYFKDNTITCKCGCMFSYEPKDLVRLMCRDKDIRTLVICPECKERNYLD